LLHIDAFLFVRIPVKGFIEFCILLLPDLAFLGSGILDATLRFAVHLLPPAKAVIWKDTVIFTFVSFPILPTAKAHIYFAE
jgi:hypothetical protein